MAVDVNALQAAMQRRSASSQGGTAPKVQSWTESGPQIRPQSSLQPQTTAVQPGSGQTSVGMQAFNDALKTQQQRMDEYNQLQAKRYAEWQQQSQAAQNPMNVSGGNAGMSPAPRPAAPSYGLNPVETQALIMAQRNNTPYQPPARPIASMASVPAGRFGMGSSY